MNSYNGFSGEQRTQVQRFLREEERAGRLLWPTRCEACGQKEGVFDCHNEDYDKPLEYVGLCYVCHMMLHCRFRAPESWRRYCEAIMMGVRFGPVHTRDFAFIKLLLAGKDVHRVLGELPARDVFKEIGVKK